MRTVKPSRPNRPWRRRPTFGAANTRGRQVVAASLFAVLVSTLGAQVPAQAQQAAEAKRLEAQRYESVPVQPVKTTAPGPDAEEPATKVKPPAPAWPTPGTADVSLTNAAAGARSQAGQAVRAGALPVTVRPVAGEASRSATSAPAKVRVELLSKAKAEAAGVNGLLLRVSRTDGVAAAGPVEVGVDYASFASAYGADWSSRLRLVQLPECALTSPAARGCQPVPIESRRRGSDSDGVGHRVGVGGAEGDQFGYRRLRHAVRSNERSVRWCRKLHRVQPGAIVLLEPRRSSPEVSSGHTRCGRRPGRVGQHQVLASATPPSRWTAGRRPRTTSRGLSVRGLTTRRDSSNGSTRPVPMTWAERPTTAPRPATSAGARKMRCCR